MGEVSQNGVQPYTHTHARTHTRTHTRTHVHTHTCTRVHTHTYKETSEACHYPIPTPKLNKSQAGFKESKTVTLKY